MKESNQAGNRWRGVLVGLLLLASLAEFAMRGPVRLLHGGMGWNDFLSPYIQAKAWAHGDDPYTAQSLIRWWPTDNWRPPFVDENASARTLEMKRGMPSPYPISSLALLSPFAALPWHVALSLWEGISAAAVILAALALLAVCGSRFFDPCSQIFLVTMFALAPLHTGFATANPAMLAVSLVVAAFWATHSGREKTAGVLLAIAICLKPTVAGGLFLYYLLRRRWFVLAVTGTIAGIVTVVGASRLAVAHVHWLPSYVENSRRMFAAGSVDDFSRASGLRFNMINAQVFFGGIFSSGSTANLLARLLGIVLLVLWTWLCFRRRTSTGLLEVSVISILSLVAVYHRFYDAALLILPLAWSLLLVGKRSASFAILGAVVPFFVPGPTLLSDLAKSGHISQNITNSWWWYAIVLPHEAWDLILVTILLLWFMWREPPEKAVSAH
jgi:hypothetical protein